MQPQVLSRLHVIIGLCMDGTNQQVPDIKATTLVDDRRQYAVGTESSNFLRKRSNTQFFYEEVGNKFNSKKSTVATSLMSEQKDMNESCNESKTQACHEREASGIQAVSREAEEPRGAKRESCQGDDHDKQNWHDQKHLHF